MMIYKILLLAVIYILLQIFLFENLILFDIATPKAFIVFLLFLPLKFEKWMNYAISFFVGLVISIVVYPIGAHCVTAVFICMFRIYWIEIIKPKVLEHEIEDIELESQPILWLITYLVPLIFVYEFIYVVISNVALDEKTFIVFFSSSIFTSIIGIIVTFLFYKPITKK